MQRHYDSIQLKPEDFKQVLVDQVGFILETTIMESSPQEKKKIQGKQKRHI